MSISIKVEKPLDLESSVSQFIWLQKPPDEHFRNTNPQASSGYSYYMKMNRLLLYFNKHPKWLLCLGQLGEHSSLMGTESQKLPEGCPFLYQTSYRLGLHAWQVVVIQQLCVK